MSTAVVESKADPRALKIASVMDGQNFRKALAATLPRHIPQDRMIRVVLSALQTTPALLECAPETVVLSVLRAAAVGLEPDGGPLGQGYLVPFWSSKNKRKECQFIPGYRGLVKMARNSGEVKDVSAEVVYQADRFSYSMGLNPTLEHVRNDQAADPGQVTHAYAIATWRDGSKKFVVMNRREIDEIRDASASKTREGKIVGPWVEWFGEMAKKTAVRRLCKMLPLSVEQQTAIQSDAQVTTADVLLPELLGHAEVSTPEAPMEPSEAFVELHTKLPTLESVLDCQTLFESLRGGMTPDEEMQAAELASKRQDEIRATRGGRKE